MRPSSVVPENERKEYEQRFWKEPNTRMEEQWTKEKSALEEAMVKVKKRGREWLAREVGKRSRKQEKEQHAKQLEVLRNQVI
jgi:hypothetical protein